MDGENQMKKVNTGSCKTLGGASGELKESLSNDEKNSLKMKLFL